MVVIIIAILASVALPQYIKATEKARASEALQLLGAIRASQERYRSHHAAGLYTNELSDLDVELPTSSRYWKMTTLDLLLDRAKMRRTGGQYVGQVLGIYYANGQLCGTFVPMRTTATPECN